MAECAVATFCIYKFVVGIHEGTSHAFTRAKAGKLASRCKNQENAFEKKDIKKGD